MTPRCLRRLAILPLALLAGPIPAQWVEQSLTLQPGWNAIYLEVEPADAAPTSVFAGLPVESVWAFNRQSLGLRFLRVPSQLVPEDPDWLAWFPSGSAEAPLTDLFAITGGQAYLVKLGGSAAETLTVTGRPTTRRPRFVTDSFSFVGLPVEAPAPTFGALFAASPAHAGQPTFRLSPDGNWVPANPAVDRPRPGEGFWIQTAGASRYTGPVEVELPMSDGIDFGARTVTIPLTLRNPSTTARTVRLALEDSAAPPAGAPEVFAGPVPLTRYVFEPATGDFGHLPVSDSFTVSIPARGERTLTLGIDRKALAGFIPPPDATAAYQGILRVEDGAGFVRRVALRAQGSGERGGQRPFRARGSEVVTLRPGLWVGAVTIDAVSQPANEALTGSSEPLPAPQRFQFRAIMHVDANGAATLLQQVYLMFRPAVTAPDPDDPEATVVLEPARFVLVTDDALLPQFTGAILRDGEDIGRRISSAAFTFGTPQAMSADTSTGRLVQSVGLAIDYNDPLNPFKHRYHPDHNNLNEQFDQVLPEGVESYTVTRALAFEFLPEDPLELDDPGYGDTVIAGIYRESIAGIHRDTINVSGVFRLENVATVEVLNDVP